MTQTATNSQRLAPQILSGLLFIIGATLLWQCRDTAHWRDSAEFVLAATYLDIPHPPGFATYGAFGNLFSLLPFGPLAWRVHLFSIAVTLLCFLLVYKLVEIATQSLQLPAVTRLIICCLISLPLLLSPALIRQATTAEAYQLLALSILLVLWCGAQFEQTADFRFLYLGGFLSGLGLGNHPALLLFVVPGFLLFIPKLGVQRTGIAILFTCVGLSVLSFIPVRALSSPPLNTGSAVTTERFLNLVTDARDRHLRPVAITTIGNLNQSDLSKQIQISKEDAKKIINETGWYIAPLGALALATLFITLSTKTALLFFFSIASMMFFFRGWQPDPFTSVFFVLAALCGVSLSYLAARSSRALSFLSLFILVIACIPHRATNEKELTAQTAHDLPYTTGRALLQQLPPNSAFITESSWYLARYLQTVEGIRPDLFLSYLPSHLFPYYFRPVRPLIADTLFQPTPSPNERSPDLPSFGKFLSSSSKVAPVFLEPAIAIITMLSKGAAVTESGLLQIGTPESSAEFPSELMKLGKGVQQLPDSYLRRDASSYLETRSLPLAEFLVIQQGASTQSIKGLQAVCGPPDKQVCSYEVYLKMAQLALMTGDISQARQLTDAVIAARGTTPLAEQFLSTLPSQ